MDYLLNKYFFQYVPFEFPDAWKKKMVTSGMSVVRVFDWVCKAQDLRQFYDNHTSFFAAEIVLFIICLLTFIHAYRHGNRYLYTWFAILFHALNVECLSNYIPDINNFWSAQGFLTFFGMRVPLSTIFGVYHLFIYVPYIFAKRMHLPWWAEGPAVGLGAALLDLPFEILGVKLLWWSWHDTDPNIADRFYYAPWNSLYAQAAFACSFVLILKISRALLVHEVYDWKKFGHEFFCSISAGFLAFWFGIAQLGMIYHPAHDIFHIPAALTTIVFLSIYAIIVYAADRRNVNPDSRVKNPYFFDELSLAVCAFYLFLMAVVLMAKPENIISEGLHQPIGPCNVTQAIRTPIGITLQKDKFLCLKKYDEKYFDFHCVPGRKPLVTFDGEKEWYAICGTPFENKAEYVFLIWSICILSTAIFYQAAARSGRTPKIWHLIHRSPPPYQTLHTSPTKSSTHQQSQTTSPSKPKTRSEKKKE